MDEGEAVEVSTATEAGEFSLDKDSIATSMEEDTATPQSPAVSLLKKLPPPLASAEVESVPTADSTEGDPLTSNNDTMLIKESSSNPPAAASLPLHSPSMTSSPRSAELASSEVSIDH